MFVDLVGSAVLPCSRCLECADNGVTKQSASFLTMLTWKTQFNRPLLVSSEVPAKLAFARIASTFRGRYTVSCLVVRRLPKLFHLLSPISADDFAAGLVEKVEKFKIGPGGSEGVTHGPLINDKAIQKCMDQANDAKQNGAKILTGEFR